MRLGGLSGQVAETWKWIPGFEGKYEVSNLGNLRSWASPNGLSGSIPSSPRPMKSTRNYAGYHVVTLCGSEGERKQYRLHCLVLETFVGPRPDGFQGAHEDDNKERNELSNLAWKHPGDNYRDRNRNGRTARGRRVGSYKHGKFVGTNRRYYPPKYVAQEQ